MGRDVVAPMTDRSRIAGAGARVNRRDRAIYGLDGLTLGERLRRARRRSGRKQTELAFSAETTAFEISRWENDHSMPSLYAFASLAEKLGVPMEQLFWGPLPGDAGLAFVGAGRTTPAGEEGP